MGPFTVMDVNPDGNVIMIQDIKEISMKDTVTLDQGKDAVTKSTTVNVKDIFKEPDTGAHPVCIRRGDTVKDLQVDSLVNGKWKCRSICQIKTKGLLTIKIVGKHINAWVSPYTLKQCKMIP